MIDSRPGACTLQALGRAATLFQDEDGGHRWQELSGNRVHTSTVTVAILPEPSAGELVLRPEDLDIVATTGSGPGGQHRNKTASAIQLTHIPTQTRVRIESERSQHQNRELALSVLRARLWAQQTSAQAAVRQQDRRQQIGSGMRGDKRRTIRSDGVADHKTGRRWRYDEYVRGKW